VAQTVATGLTIWTSFTDIGRSLGGVVLTEQEYQRVEHAYSSVALAFLTEAGLASVRVEGLENCRPQLLALHEGTVLPAASPE
jgi:hypothetical protein